MVNQDLEAQLAEKEKLQSKSKIKRHSINLMILKIKLKTNELKSDLTELEKKRARRYLLVRCALNVCRKQIVPSLWCFIE